MAVAEYLHPVFYLEDLLLGLRQRICARQKVAGQRLYVPVAEEPSGLKWLNILVVKNLGHKGGAETYIMDTSILTELVLMPIFEYVCQECDHKFEAIVLGRQKPQCPKCESKRLEQQISKFAVSTDGSSASAEPAGPCGACGDPRGPGACSMN